MGGRFSSSSSSNASSSTFGGERAAAARAESQGSDSTGGVGVEFGGGLGMSSPPGFSPVSAPWTVRGGAQPTTRSSFNHTYPGIPGTRRETNSSNESQSGQSGASSPTALLSPTIAVGFQHSFNAAVPQAVPSRVPNPPSLDEPFSSSPVHLRSQLTQQARSHRQAKLAGLHDRNRPL